MGHITDLQIRNFYLHRLRVDEEQELLEHAANCDFCSGRLAAGFPEEELLTPPPDMKEEIIERAGRIPTRRQRRRAYYGYCTRVVLGMCLAFVLLGSGSFGGKLSRYVSSLRERTGIGTSIVLTAAPLLADGGDTCLDERTAYQLQTEQWMERNREEQEDFLQRQQEENEKWMGGEATEKQSTIGKLISRLRNGGLE